MGSIKNILIHCQDNEKEYAKYGIVSRDRDRNLGWIECSKFFFDNFDLTEKEVRDDA